MNYYIGTIQCSSELYHHGIKGQKWGIRRYQNPDGTRTAAGKARYSLKEKEDIKFKPKEKTLNSTYHEKQVLSTKGKNGKEITLSQIDKSLMARGLAHISNTIRQQQLNNKDFDIIVEGKKIGNMELQQISSKEINGVWLQINDKYRGNGYATACLMVALHEAKKKDYSVFSLEVPGSSPDARHIYEKLGFVAKEQVSDEDDVWGGLTRMELDLKKYDL